MNTITHFEIAARDPQKAKAFYEHVFGWRISEGERLLEISDQDAGVSGHILPWNYEEPPYVAVYLKVADLQATLDKATEEGARVIVPPTPIPTGIFGLFLDPEGHPVGLIQYQEAD